MRKRCLACSVLIALMLTTGCATTSPRQEKERERKAAGIGTFRIHCSKDLWNYIDGKYNFWGTHSAGDIEAKVTPAGSPLVTVELTGPNLVKLLQKLDYFAHGGDDNHDPRAMRMYDAIAPRIDAIRPGQSDGTVPEVTINDSTGIPSTPTATPTPTPKAS